MDASAFEKTVCAALAQRGFKVRREQGAFSPTPNRRLVLLTLLQNAVKKLKSAWETNSDTTTPEDKLSRTLAIITALQSEKHGKVAQVRFLDGDLAPLIPGSGKM